MLNVELPHFIQKLELCYRKYDLLKKSTKGINPQTNKHCKRCMQSGYGSHENQDIKNDHELNSIKSCDLRIDPFGQ